MATEAVRQRKPQLYAGAGIPHFWRVEKEGGAVVLYAFELDPATRQYGLVGIFRDRVKPRAAVRDRHRPHGDRAHLISPV